MFAKKTKMKKTVVAIAAFFLAQITNAQSTVNLTENTPVTNNGLEYGYTIKNESNKSVKGEDFDRYVVELYVTNKSGCQKIIPLQFDKEGKIDDDKNTIAEFNVINATGKRLTSKKGKIAAKKITQTVKVDVPIPGNVEGITQATLGFGIKNGESITSSIIVIVPKGQRPNVTGKLNFIPDIY